MGKGLTRSRKGTEKSRITNGERWTTRREIPNHQFSNGERFLFQEFFLFLPVFFGYNTARMNNDFDGAWKETLEKYLQPFLELCYPKVAEKIDWSRNYEFLDKELQQIAPASDTGKQTVDKLIKVVRLDGKAGHVLCHIEVQSQQDTDFPRRCYQYNHRLDDRYAEPVVSLVFLADTNPSWRPACYEQELWGCRIRFDFPICKLTDFGGIEALYAMDNPVAIVMAAHLVAQQTQPEDGLRFQWKRQLVCSLYERNYSKNDIRELFRLIEWLLVMPEKSVLAFNQELIEFEKEKSMPYITSFERYGREKGLQEGLQQLTTSKQHDILEVLEIRFERVPDGLRETIEEISDIEKLSKLLRSAVRCADLEGFAADL